MLKDFRTKIVFIQRKRNFYSCIQKFTKHSREVLGTENGAFCIILDNRNYDFYDI